MTEVFKKCARMIAEIKDIVPWFEGYNSSLGYRKYLACALPLQNSVQRP